MRAEDAERVAELAALDGASAWDALAFRNELLLTHACLHVVESAPGGELLAFAVWWEVVDEVHLLNLVVEPAHRRQGWARRLLAELKADAEAIGARAVLLEVRAGNEAAQRLYLSLGFERVGHRRAYYADGEDALLMEWRLAQ